MRNRIFAPMLALTLFVCLASFARAQQDPNEETVRGAFLSTRVSASAAVGSTGSSSSSGSRTRRQSRSSSNRSTSGATTKGAVSVGVGAKGATGSKGASSAGSRGNTTNVPVNSYAGTPLGLGYSLYMRDSSGDAVRVDPSRTFHAGDRIRISLETNTDGYLYVFHTENNGEPEMLYPDAKLDEGDNFVEAHVPYEIPWSGEVSDNLRWFVFDQNPANERLYIVLTREPLPAVPTGQQLVSYCNNSQNRCPWRPGASFWSQVKVNSSGKVVVNKKAATYGLKQTATERDATTRGLGLGTSDPEPSVVRMNASSNAGILVTALDLIHQ